MNAQPPSRPVALQLGKCPACAAPAFLVVDGAIADGVVRPTCAHFPFPRGLEPERRRTPYVGAGRIKRCTCVGECGLAHFEGAGSGRMSEGRCTGIAGRTALHCAGCLARMESRRKSS